MMLPPLQASAVLLDIEGTLGSKTFLSQVLAPYAQQHLRDYVDRHRDTPVVAQALLDTQALAGDTVSDPVGILLHWISQDRKAPPLKKLQGLVWRRGFEQGAFQGHLFIDAVRALQRWHQAGVPLAIYSSGSVQAQQLYFGHSVAGDLRPWLSAYFDTDIGAKVEAASYACIALALGQPAAQVLFLSDSVAELQAARSVGMQVLHVVREDTVADARFTSLTSFDGLQIQ